MAQPVWKQYRNVVIGGDDVSNFDMDIIVTNPREDPLEYELTIYNLNEDTFEDIESGETGVQIELGWENGPQDVVVTGSVENTHTEFDGTDQQYRIDGRDASEDVLRSRVDGTFFEEPPEDIAAALAGEVGLGAETDTTGEAIQPTFAVGTHQRLTHWLEELTDYAGQFTGETWTYWAEAGTLYFVVDDGIDESIPKLSYDGLLTSVNPKADEDTREKTIEFEAMCEPRIKRGQQVRVETDRITGNFEIRSYEYKSSTVTGDHLVRGTAEQLTPAESYEDNVTRTGGGGGPQFETRR